jgi:dimethylamine--corrinoid protein Co-methyltransferase
MGMAIAHIMASCMGDIRTAGDLVAWMQMTRKIKINETKTYVAQKLGIDIFELTDEDVMRDIRRNLGIGTVTSIAGGPNCIRAKMKVAEILDIKIRSVEIYKSQIGL